MGKISRNIDRAAPVVMSGDSVAYLNFVDWKDQSRSFAGLAAYRWEDYDATGGGQPEHLSGKMVSRSIAKNSALGGFLPRPWNQPRAGPRL